MRLRDSARYGLAILVPLVAIVGLGAQKRTFTGAKDHRVGRDGGGEGALRLRGSDERYRERGVDLFHRLSLWL